MIELSMLRWDNNFVFSEWAQYNHKVISFIKERGRRAKEGYVTM